jgi:hypothetical protein
MLAVAREIETRAVDVSIASAMRQEPIIGGGLADAFSALIAADPELAEVYAADRDAALSGSLSPERLLVLAADYRELAECVEPCGYRLGMGGMACARQKGHDGAHWWTEPAKNADP